jgi:hypothetical protein
VVHCITLYCTALLYIALHCTALWREVVVCCGAAG